MSALVAIFLVVLLFRTAMRHQRRVVQPTVQVIVVQPGVGAVQVPTLPGPPPPEPAHSQYSQPFSPGFLGLNRQN